MSLMNKTLLLPMKKSLLDNHLKSIINLISKKMLQIYFYVK